MVGGLVDCRTGLGRVAMAGTWARSSSVVALVVVLSGCAWGMAGHGPERSAFSPFESSITPANVGQLTESWRSAWSNLTSAPVTGGGKVFVSAGSTATTANDSLVAFDMSGGGACVGVTSRRCDPSWTVSFPPALTLLHQGPLVSPPSFDSGRVYAGLTHTDSTPGTPPPPSTLCHLSGPGHGPSTQRRIGHARPRRALRPPRR
jgi:hypothetical protein